MDKRVRAALRELRSPERPFEHAVGHYDYGYSGLVDRLEALTGKPIQELRVLDMGCGYSYPTTFLLHAAGVDVSGVDIDPVFFRDGRLATFRERLREKGDFLRALHHAGPRYSGYRQFFSVLAELANSTVDHDVLSLHTYDGRTLPFPDATFDVVCSLAVLEHVGDLPAFVSETARVLRPDGVVDMVWHNFYSPSGGHRSLPEDISKSPWGHVTGESPPPCFLNRKRPEEIQREFEKHLTVRGIVGIGSTGVERLNDEWRRKLPGLSDELLTTGAYLLQAVRDN